MRQRGFMLCGLVGVLVVGWILSRSSEKKTTDPPMDESSGDRSTKLPGIRSPLEEPLSSLPRGPETDTVEGKAPYDTGIPNDPRIRHTEDGKHVFIEALGIANEINAPESEPEMDLERVNEVMSFYRMAYGENPVAADNQSVMAALLGDNPKGLVFFPSEHPSLSPDGELLDRWGTPYYFHALSGQQMEVVSPGADRLLGNDDDLIHTQRDEEEFFRGFTEEPPEPAGEP